jgi:hypothetical protein
MGGFSDHRDQPGQTLRVGLRSKCQRILDRRILDRVWIYDVEARPMSFLVGRDGVLLDWTEFPGDGDYASFANWVDPHLEL